MEKTLSLGIVLNGEDKLSPTLGKVTGQIHKFESKIKVLGRSMTKYGTISLATGSAITASIGSVVMSYQKLAAAQGDISSLGIGVSGISQITKEARNFSNQFAGTTAPEFVKASYDIKSGIASLSDEGVAKFTTLAAMTGAATIASTEEMTKLFALGHGIFKNIDENDFEFGERMSAQIGLAVKNFRTKGSDLVLGISNIGAMAKKMGVTLSEELAIIGNSKGAFDTASEAATGYRAFLTGVGKAQEELGLKFTDSTGNMLPMVDVLESIKKKYGQTLSTVAVQDEIKKAFGSAEAVKTINGLIDKTDKLRQSQIDLNNASLDNVEIMAKTRNKGREFELLNQQLGNTTTIIGSVFAPAALGLGKAIGSISMKLNMWMDKNKDTVKTIGWVVGAISALLVGVGTLGITIGGFMLLLPTVAAGLTVVKIGILALGGAIKAMGIAFLSNPIFLAIGAIAGSAYLIYKNWEPIEGFFLSLWTKVKNLFQNGKDFIKKIFSYSPLEVVIKSYGKVFDWLGSKFNWFGRSMKKFKSLGSSIKGFFGFSNTLEKNEERKSFEGRSGNKVENTPAVAKTNFNYTSVPKLNIPGSRSMQQTNHIKVNITNPSSNLDVEKAIVKAMGNNNNERSLSDDFQ